MHKTTACSILALLLVSGCGREDDSLSRQAGKGVSDSIGDFVAGVSESVDEQMKIEIKLSEELTQLGFSTTVSKLVVGDPSEKMISVYVLSTNAYSGVMVAKAVNKDALEIGRARADVELAADDAQYVRFTFPREMDRAQVVRYELSMGK